MTLYEFLRKTNVDIKDNQSHLGNHLVQSLLKKG